ncbi:hypothetical protein [Nocardia puris]
MRDPYLDSKPHEAGRRQPNPSAPGRQSLGDVTAIGHFPADR